MGISKGFTFDGEKSLDYYICITGEAVYNSPVREVESISIPGRNGELKLDKGRFENIEVIYPAGTFASSQTGFATKMTNFRNFLASRKGYKKLEDDYHTDEFRLALFKEGFEVDPTAMSKAGEFDIVFDCKPQRYLKTGEAETAVSDGDTITNPTLFESSPLLKVVGRGNINFNSYDVDINVDPLGNTLLFNSVSDAVTAVATFGNVAYSTGDTITVNLSSGRVVYRPLTGASITSGTITGITGGLSIIAAVASLQSDGTLNVTIKTAKQTFTEGTSATKTATIALEIAGTDSNNQAYTDSVNISLQMSYNSSTDSISLQIGPIWPSNSSVDSTSVQIGSGYIDSTASSLNETIYIDCEIGEAYIEQNGDLVSMNGAVSIGAELPVLAPGANTVTFDNTITDLKIIPRWWRI